MGWEKRFGAAVVVAVFLASQGAVQAQNTEPQVWIQIEARNTVAAAQERFERWAAQFPEAAGFRLTSGWYAVALGPFSEGEARAQLTALRAAGAIPADSFIPDNRLLQAQVWPNVAGPGSAALAGQTAAPAGPAGPPAAGSGVVAAEAPPAETLAQARAHEAALSREDRMDLQRALQWAGHYSAAIDGALGPGTRASVSAWQSAQGAEPTGVLTPSQAGALVGGWQREAAVYGFSEVRDDEAGIAVQLPLALVEFDRYAPPFALYRPRSGSGVQIRLISLPGDAGVLEGLYNQLASGGLVPGEGARELRADGFTLTGQSREAEVRLEVVLRDGAIRGWMMSTGSAHPARSARIAQTLSASFAPIGNQVLDPGLVPLDETLRLRLQDGLSGARPGTAVSGFFIDQAGLVLTAAAPLAGCQALELSGGQRVELAWSDAALGLAVLRSPVRPAPQSVAQLALQLPAAGSEAVLAGYPFGEALALPTVSWGRFRAPTREQPASTSPSPKPGGPALLSITALPGDAGGAVLGADGLVIGALLPAASAAAQPEGTGFMVPAPQILAALKAQGLSVQGHAPVAGAMAPEDLNRQAGELAVQVLCR